MPEAIIATYTSRVFDASGDCVGREMTDVDVSVLLDGDPIERAEWA